MILMNKCIHKKILVVTKTNNRLNCNVFSTGCLIETVLKYNEREKFRFLCEMGCLNYMNKWSCPPFSPSFERYASSFNYLTVYLMSIDLAQLSYIKNDYLKVKAANVIMKSRIDRTVRYFLQLNNQTKYITTGSCRHCKPCNCKKGLPCKHPELLTFSFEALGINVQDMVQNLFGISLLWYKKGYLPEYTAVVTGILSKTPFDANIIVDALEDVNVNEKVSHALMNI